jgi:L-lactate dehydrogenase complex protein LldF
LHPLCACLNACPVYQQVGGHAYGSVYPGPVGAVLTPGLRGLAGWEDLPQASSLCGACREVCPVRIDIPRMLLSLRDESTRLGLTPAWATSGLRLLRRLAVRPKAFRVAQRLAARATRTPRARRLDPLAARASFRVDPPERLSGLRA